VRDAVLALELSTAHGSVAVVAGDEVLYEAAFEAKRSHNAQVFGPLGVALEVAGERLRGLVVGTGPGSYTGVRIAIAAAQGIALSRQVPVLPISSLLGSLSEKTFGVVGNARRGRFYVAEVREGILQEEIALFQPDEVEEAMADTGLQRWISCDEVAPIPGIECRVPMARRLAGLGCGFDFDASQERLLEPIYLEGAFITQARKR